jgi:hypothetical protein
VAVADTVSVTVFALRVTMQEPGERPHRDPGCR